MIQIKEKLKKIIDKIGCIFILVGIVIVVYMVSQSDFYSIYVGDKDSDGIVENVGIKIISPAWKIEYVSTSTENITVADFLFECSSHYNFEIEKEYWGGYQSFFIKSINNIENGNDGRYWQFYVNNKFADVGCSNYFLNDNDVVEWRFEKSPWQ